MIERLPRWVEPGALLLAFNAGGINAVGLLSLEHQSISHATGSAAWLGLSLAQSDWRQASYLGVVILCFLLGAMVSGMVIRGAALQLGRRYTVCLLLEMALLGAALLTFLHSGVGGAFWASAACGVQNAMVTTYSGSIVRTTHITGTVTDLGLALGHWLRRLPVDLRRVRLSVLVVVGFLIGAAGGAAAWLQAGHWSLMLPMLLCLALAAVSWRFRRG